MDYSTELPWTYPSWNAFYDDVLKAEFDLTYTTEVYWYFAIGNINVLTRGVLKDHDQLTFSVHHIERMALAEARGVAHQSNDRFTSFEIDIVITAVTYTPFQQNEAMDKLKEKLGAYRRELSLNERKQRRHYPTLFGSLMLELHGAGFEMREAQSNLDPDPVQDTSAPDQVRKPLRAQVKCRPEDLPTVERYFDKYGYRVETMWKQAGADVFEFHYFRNHTNE